MLCPDANEFLSPNDESQCYASSFDVNEFDSSTGGSQCYAKCANAGEVLNLADTLCIESCSDAGEFYTSDNTCISICPASEYITVAGKSCIGQMSF